MIMVTGKGLLICKGICVMTGVTREMKVGDEVRQRGLDSCPQMMLCVSFLPKFDTL